MNECPECKNQLYGYLDHSSGFTQTVCWVCGHYEDDSPAFRLMPELFKDVLRNNRVHFMRKFAHQPKVNTNNTTDKETEPVSRNCYLTG